MRLIELVSRIALSCNERKASRWATVCGDNIMNKHDPNNLDANVERLYIAFSKYPTWSQHPGCPCCHDPVLQEPLKTKKLRDLTHADLFQFGCDAMLTWGDVDDFRYFLPRLLELSIESHISKWDTYLVLNKLGSVDWQSWPADEGKAIADFLHQWWLTTLNTIEHQVSADDVLTVLGHAYQNLEPFLSEWRNIRTEAAFQNFIETFCCWNGNYCLPEQCNEQIVNWLQENETRTWLEAGYDEYVDEEWAVNLEEFILELKRESFDRWLPLFR